MPRLVTFDEYLVAPGCPIREAMVRLNSTTHLFQLVADRRGVVHGTITDGDVRRALLRGVTLDAPVESCMRTDFIAGRRGAGADNEALLAGERSVPFLPVLNEDGSLAEILVRTSEDSGIAHALVMAGGFGRRLGDRTRSTPKPLLEVGGRAILDHVLANLESFGVGTINIAIHYLADQIRSFVQGRPNRSRMVFVEETTPLGTAGALSQLSGLGRAPLLVINGDVITKVDLAALHSFHLRHGLDATLGVARYDIEVPFGVVRHSDDGLFAGIEEKPRISNFIAAGVYYLSPEFVALVPSDRPMDMPELLNLGREIGLKIGLFPIHEYWTDVGRVDDLQSADRLLSPSPGGA